LMMITTCQKARTRWRAYCCGMPLRISQTVLRQPIESRHFDATAIRRPRRLSRIVIKNDQHIRRILRCFCVQKCRPVRRRISNIEFYFPPKFTSGLAHRSVPSFLSLICLFDVLQFPTLVEERFEWSIEAEDRKPTFTRHGLDPVAAVLWFFWSEGDVDR